MNQEISHHASVLTSVPDGLFGSEDDRVPRHEVVLVRRRTDALRWILLHPLEVTDQALSIGTEVPIPSSSATCLAALAARPFRRFLVRFFVRFLRTPSWPAWTWRLCVEWSADAAWRCVFVAVMRRTRSRGRRFSSDGFPWLRVHPRNRPRIDGSNGTEGKGKTWFT